MRNHSSYNLVGQSVRELDAETFESIRRDPDSVFQRPDATVIKDGRSAKLVRVPLPLNGRMVDVAYKRVQRTGWLRIPKSIFQKNRVTHCWQMADRFLEAGVPTPRPILVFTPKGRLSTGPGYLATEWIRGGLALDEFMASMLDRSYNWQREIAAVVATELGRLFGRMHRAGIAHRDLKEENILLLDIGDHAPVIYFLDLDGAATPRQITPRRRWRNIARLLTSGREIDQFQPTDCRLFLKSYFRAIGGDDAAWKSAWHEIRKYSDAKMRRRKRQGRGPRLIQHRAAA